jgi:hypothetical protein
MTCLGVGIPSHHFHCQLQQPCSTSPCRCIPHPVAVQPIRRQNRGTQLNDSPGMTSPEDFPPIRRPHQTSELGALGGEFNVAQSTWMSEVKRDR